MTEEKYKGVPRSKIPWYPTIDYEKCINCGKCVEYCKLDVYEFEEKQVDINIMRYEAVEKLGDGLHREIRGVFSK